LITCWVEHVGKGVEGLFDEYNYRVYDFLRLAQIRINRDLRKGSIKIERAHIVSVIISRHFMHLDVPSRLKLFESVRVTMFDPVSAGPHDFHTVFSVTLPSVRLDDIVVVFEKDAAKRDLFCFPATEDEEAHFAQSLAPQSGPAQGSRQDESRDDETLGRVMLAGVGIAMICSDGVGARCRARMRRGWGGRGEEKRGGDGTDGSCRWTVWGRRECA
jgi:hypothetical protein